METKKANLWKDSENQEINPEFTSSNSDTAQQWGPSIVYLKKKSIECTEFDPNSRPSFEDLNEDLERIYEANYSHMKEYEGMV